MELVSIELKNCYGIKVLKKDLDFSKSPAYALYAPNGVMKSSLAQTFQDAANKNDSQDRIFAERKTVRKIVDENGKEIEGDRVLVVLPYDSEYGPTEKTSTLLVDAKLRKEHEKLQLAVDEASGKLLKAIGQQAGSKRDFEEEISSSIMRSADKFENAVARLQKEISQQKETPFANVSYDIIFNDKVQKALETKGLKDAVEDYIHRYNELIASSTYFRKGTFDYYNAGQIAKSLADNGFFNAKHTVNLKSTGGAIEITNQDQLEEVIVSEKEKIISDKKLREKFNSVQKQLEKNAELREFCHYLEDNDALLSRMNNMEQFREDVLKSYLKVHEGLYNELMATLESVELGRKRIAAEAEKQRTQWDEVIRIFNDRFVVPFDLVAKNRIGVMLGDAQIAQLGFIYRDGTESKEVEKPTLMTVLSMGERRALYILNVIFEIQRRKKDGQETLFVIDDIADSFDYRNKYAIIQYLNETSMESIFKLVIMTHNFDFFRTLNSRFVAYRNCLMASKNSEGITLTQASDIRNPFANDWRGRFFTHERKQIASICFLRNIIEMTKGETDPKFMKLTSMLHWKPDSADLTVGELDKIFTELCGVAGKSKDPSRKVCELILEEAKICLRETSGLNLENKIVLAMAIRLAAEKFIIAQIRDDAYVASIQSNQTHNLIEKYKAKFPGQIDTIMIFDKVALMTPENIHVNAFMYEPIVDTPDDHLKKLYAEVTSLK